MSVSMREDYLNKKNIILVQIVNENTLRKLCMKYEKEVNSKRRLSTIDSIGTLIELLEKRACVSEKNLIILEEIAKEINVPLKIANPQQIHIVPKIAQRITRLNSNDATEKVHEEIILRIGGQWILFARALDIQDGDIDTIYKNLYNNQPRECIKTILDFHKHNALSRDWKLQLLEALSAARRNDLRKKIEYIFENF